MESSPKSNPKHRLWLAVKLVAVAVIIYFLVRQVLGHWQEIKSYDWHLDFGYLLVSIVVGIVTFWLFSLNWRILIAGFGHDVSPAKSFRIFYLANLGRYVPGKFMQFFGVIYLTRKESIPPEHAAASFVLVQLFAIPASFLVFVLGAQLEPLVLVEQVAVLGERSAFMMTGIMLVACAGIVIWPDRVLSLGNIVLGKLGRAPIVFHLDKRVALIVLIGYCLAWIGYGLAFWLFLQAVMADAAVGPVASIAAFNAAYQIGYLVLFAPGGFGPRELALGALLTPFLGAALAPAVAIMARIWAIVIETIAAAISLTIKQ